MAAGGGPYLRAIQFHYHPARYLWTRWASRYWPRVALGASGCLRLKEVQPPDPPGPGWVRVKTRLSGVCGSDLSAITASDSFTLEPFGAYPFTFGHENLGELLDAADGWSAGERVVVCPMIACAQRGARPPCAPCARGEYGLCRNTFEGGPGKGPLIGFCPGAGGGWSSQFVAHVSQLRRVGSMADEVAVLADPFVSALHPVLLHPPAEDDVALVIGAGALGILTVASLRAMGWRGPLAVLARHRHQLEACERAGADHRFLTRDALYRWAESLPGARGYKPTLAGRFVEGGPSLVYDTAGTASSLRDAVALAREGGRIVLAGAAARLTVDWTRLWYRQISVSGVFAYGPVTFRGARHDVNDAALALMAEGHLDRLGLLTHVFPLEEFRDGVNAALDKAGRRSLKVAFRPA